MQHFRVLLILKRGLLQHFMVLPMNKQDLLQLYSTLFMLKKVLLQHFGALFMLKSSLLQLETLLIQPLQGWFGLGGSSQGRRRPSPCQPLALICNAVALVRG